jgi:hypothetical protein
MTMPNTKPKKPTIADADTTKLPAVPGDNIRIVPATFPGEKQTSQDAQVDRFASAITAEWRKSIEGILTTATLCAEARKTLNYQQREELYRILPFKEPMFSKLVSIGANKALFDEKIQKHLPANWTIIHLLRNLTEKEIDKAISQKALTPGTTRNDLSKWLSQNSSHRKEDRRRAAPNKAHHDSQVQSLVAAFKSSPELAERLGLQTAKPSGIGDRATPW